MIITYFKYLAIEIGILVLLGVSLVLYTLKKMLDVYNEEYKKENGLD